MKLGKKGDKEKACSGHVLKFGQGRDHVGFDVLEGDFASVTELEQNGEVSAAFFKGSEKGLFVEAVSFAKAAFEAIAADGAFEVAFWSGKSGHDGRGDELFWEVEEINHPQGAACEGLLVGE